jgi:hypothetical protein
MIQELIDEAEKKYLRWYDIANDPDDLADSGKTGEEAMCLANYYEGRYDAFVEVLGLLSKVTR